MEDFSIFPSTPVPPKPPPPLPSKPEAEPKRKLSKMYTKEEKTE